MFASYVRAVSEPKHSIMAITINSSVSSAHILLFYVVLYSVILCDFSYDAREARRFQQLLKGKKSAAYRVLSGRYPNQCSGSVHSISPCIFPFNNTRRYIIRKPMHFAFRGRAAFHSFSPRCEYANLAAILHFIGFKAFYFLVK